MTDLEQALLLVLLAVAVGQLAAWTRERRLRAELAAARRSCLLQRILLTSARKRAAKCVCATRPSDAA